MKRKIYIPYLALLTLFMLRCSPTKNVNPAAVGFNKNSSDLKAIKLADRVMEAMGGYNNWANTRYIHWNFFGARTLLWDKHKNRVKIDSKKNDFIAVVNLNDNSGHIVKNGELIQHPDSLSKYITKAHDIWINDSYWLVMPYKLKDSGVTLKYLGQKETTQGTLAEVIQLTFNEVGVTPENKYEVFIDPTTHLVSQWTFYSKASDTEPRFSTPWKHYKKYGNILLSGDRGEHYQLSDIWVKDALDESYFQIR